MEDEPVIVPSAQGEAQQGRGGDNDNDNGGDGGSNGSSEEGVLVSPSSSPEPELDPAAAAAGAPPSYPLRGSVVAGEGLYRIDTHGAEDLTPGLLKEVKRET